MSQDTLCWIVLQHIGLEDGGPHKEFCEPPFANEAVALNSIGLSYCNVQGVAIEKAWKNEAWLVMVQVPAYDIPPTPAKVDVFEVRPFRVSQKPEHL